MLLTVLVLSGTILGTTTIAGLLTLYQIRQSTDIINSGKAIFAADAGLECEFYRFTQNKPADFCQGVVQELTNDAFFTTTSTTKILPPPPATTTQRIIESSGTSRNAIRAFKAVIQ